MENSKQVQMQLSMNLLCFVDYLFMSSIVRVNRKDIEKNIESLKRKSYYFMLFICASETTLVR